MIVPYPKEEAGEYIIGTLILLVLSAALHVATYLVTPDSSLQLSMSSFSNSQLLTALLSHDNRFHLLLGLIGLYLGGVMLENRLGSVMFLFAFLVGGLTGELCHLIIFKGMPHAVSVGGMEGSALATIISSLILWPRQSLRLAAGGPGSNRISPFPVVALWLVMLFAYYYYRIATSGLIPGWGLLIGGVLVGGGMGLLFHVMHLGEEYQQRRESILAAEVETVTQRSITVRQHIPTASNSATQSVRRSPTSMAATPVKRNPTNHGYRGGAIDDWTPQAETPEEPYVFGPGPASTLPGADLQAERQAALASRTQVSRPYADQTANSRTQKLQRTQINPRPTAAPAGPLPSRAPTRTMDPSPQRAATMVGPSIGPNPTQTMSQTPTRTRMPTATQLRTQSITDPHLTMREIDQYVREGNTYQATQIGVALTLFWLERGNAQAAYEVSTMLFERIKDPRIPARALLPIAHHCIDQRFIDDAKWIAERVIATEFDAFGLDEFLFRLVDTLADSGPTEAEFAEFFLARYKLLSPPQDRYEYLRTKLYRLQQAIRLTPADRQLAGLIQAGRFEEGIAALRSMENNTHIPADYLIELARGLLSHRSIEDSAEVLAIIPHLYPEAPETPTAVFNLIYLFAEYLNYPQQAVVWFRYLKTSHPSAPATEQAFKYLDTKGIIRRRHPTDAPP